MPTHTILRALAALLSIVCTSCSDIPETSTPPLALEAWIDSDGYPTALLTVPLKPSAKPVDVADAMVRWGKVTISDGTTTVVMTGGPDNQMLPPYSYRSYQMRGRVGDSYTITAEYEGHRATATATILPPATIDTITFQCTGASRYTGVIDFTPAMSSDTGRYVVYTRVLGSDTRHYPSFMGNVSTPPGAEHAQAPLYRGKHALEPFDAAFSRGDTIDVILARVEPQVYRFWGDYTDAVYFENYVFISSTTSARGNVDGALGVFSARGCARRLVTVE